MYAVFESGGKQHRAETGERLVLERLKADEGADISFDNVLMVDVDGELTVGTPYIPNSKVHARVISHSRQPKIRVIKFKRRKNYLRRQGHRQLSTIVEITSISNEEKNNGT